MLRLVVVVLGAKMVSDYVVVNMFDIVYFFIEIGLLQGIRKASGVVSVKELRPGSREPRVETWK